MPRTAHSCPWARRLWCSPSTTETARPRTSGTSISCKVDPLSCRTGSVQLPRHHRRDRLLPNVLPLVQHRASPWRDRDAHPGRRPSSSNPERAGPARAHPSSRLDPSSRTLRSRHPKTRPPSRSGLDQSTRDIHNRRDCSVNRNRQCLKVVDRFRSSECKRRCEHLLKFPYKLANRIGGSPARRE